MIKNWNQFIREFVEDSNNIDSIINDRMDKLEMKISNIKESDPNTILIYKYDNQNDSRVIVNFTYDDLSIKYDFDIDGKNDVPGRPLYLTKYAGDVIDFEGPVNIGSEEMVTINQLAKMAIEIAEKDITIKNIEGDEFVQKYGFKCPLGVKGRNSDNKLYREKIGWEVSQPLSVGLKKTYQWIKSQVDKKENETVWIYESPDGGDTVYKRESQST